MTHRRFFRLLVVLLVVVVQGVLGAQTPRYSRSRQQLNQMRRPNKKAPPKAPPTSALNVRGGGRGGGRGSTSNKRVPPSTKVSTTADGPPPLTASLVCKIVAFAAGPMLGRIAVAAAAAASASDGAAAASALPLPDTPQLLIAACWALNMVAVAAPGRYDGQPAAARAREAAEARTPRTANLFAPAGWAFAIWAPIFLGEFLMMLLLTGVPASWLSSAAAEATTACTLAAVRKAIAPGWCLGILAQVAWCLTFRPSVCGPKTLWLPATLLAATAVGLGFAHRALRTLLFAASSSSIGGGGGIDFVCAATGEAPSGLVVGTLDALVRWPLVLHFGWITAA